MTNYYQCLGLTNSATVTQVRVAYREFAKNYHPDKHSNSEFFKQRFQEIQQAYETLADASSRAAYDSKYARYTSGTTSNSAPGDTAKLKDLTLKVSKLESSVKEKEQMLTSLVAKVRAKETECERLKRLNSDFTGQIGMLSALIRAEDDKNKSVAHLLKSAFLLLLKKHLVLCVAFVIMSILVLLIQSRSSSKLESINLVEESINADSLINKGQYLGLLHRMDDLINSNRPVNQAALERAGKQIELADLHTFRAYAKSKLLNDTGAVKDLTYVIKNRSIPSAHAYYYRALAKWKMGEGSGYFADINRALSIDPNFTEARISRAANNFAVGKYANAIADYRFIYKLEPTNSENLNSIGECYYKMREYKSACSIWTKAKDLGSSSAVQNLRFRCR